MYYDIHSDGMVLSALEKMKNSNMLNSVSANVLPFATFMDVPKSVLAYARSFHDSYDVPFDEVQIADIVKDMESASFIPAAS